MRMFIRCQDFAGPMCFCVWVPLGHWHLFVRKLLVNPVWWQDETSDVNFTEHQLLPRGLVSLTGSPWRPASPGAPLLPGRPWNDNRKPKVCESYQLLDIYYFVESATGTLEPGRPGIPSRPSGPGRPLHERSELSLCYQNGK